MNEQARHPSVGAPVERTVTWTAHDVRLYNFGVGVGNRADLRYENAYIDRERPIVLPSFAAVLGMPDRPALEALLGHETTGLREVAQDVVPRERLPPEGEARVSSWLVADDGTFAIHSTICDPADGRLLATSCATLSSGAAAPRHDSRPPHEVADAEFAIRTDRRQVLLYGSSCDHAPELVGHAAETTLNPRLIYGTLCKAVVDELLGGSADKVTRFAADLCTPLQPGEMVVARAWEIEGGIALEVRPSECVQTVACYATVELDGGWTSGWTFRVTSGWPTPLATTWPTESRHE
jgi:hypothetical protein